MDTWQLFEDWVNGKTDGTALFESLPEIEDFTQKRKRFKELTPRCQQAVEIILGVADLNPKTLLRLKRNGESMELETCMLLGNDNPEIQVGEGETMYSKQAV